LKVPFCKCPDCLEREGDEALLEAIAMHDEGASFSSIARQLGCTPAVARDLLMNVFLEDAAHEGVRH
jgi:hypothetical protein